MVTPNVPRVAVIVAVNEIVTVHVGLHGLLPKLAVTPAGRGPVENVTGVVVTLVRVAVICEVGLVEPWMTVRLFGDGPDSVKVNGGGLTTSENDVDAVVAPEVPVTVIVTVPVVAVDEAESAKVTVHGAVGVQVADAGVGTAPTPIGRADSETTTGAALPAVVVTVMTSFTGVVTP
jgi:hypothetical protein